MSGVGITGKIEPLNGGNFPVFEDINGEGGYRSVATIAARNSFSAAPQFCKEGMLVYVAAVQCIYMLGADLATWRFFMPSPALQEQTVWEINAATGNDNNDGLTVGTALATSEEWSRRVHSCGVSQGRYVPRGAAAAGVVVHFAAGAYGELYLRQAWQANLGLFGAALSIQCDYTASPPITLSAVTNTVESVGAGVRGQITTVGTLGFTAHARITCTSGPSTGAQTYSTGQNANAKNHFVKQWFNYYTAALATVAPGATVTVDTLAVSFTRIDFEVDGPGYCELLNAAFSNDVRCFVTSEDGTLDFVGCSYTSANNNIYGGGAWVNCNFLGTAVAFCGPGFPSLFGCVAQSGAVWRTVPGNILELFQGNCCDGGRIQADEPKAGILMRASIEFENGTATVALTVVAGASFVCVGGVCWGESTNYAVGANVGSCSAVSGPTALFFGVPATQQVIMTGHNLNYTDLPRSYDRADCVWAIDPDPTAVATTT